MIQYVRETTEAIQGLLEGRSEPFSDKMASSEELCVDSPSLGLMNSFRDDDKYPLWGFLNEAFPDLLGQLGS